MFVSFSLRLSSDIIFKRQFLKLPHAHKTQDMFEVGGLGLIQKDCIQTLAEKKKGRSAAPGNYLASWEQIPCISSVG